MRAATAYAIASGDKEKVRTLLDLGADPNTVLDRREHDIREMGGQHFHALLSGSTQGLILLCWRGMSRRTR